MPPHSHRSTTAQDSAHAKHHGPLDWRRVVEWLSADGVISPDEAQRTIARCSQAESRQNPLVRLANVAMERASDGKPLDVDMLTKYLAQRSGLEYLRIDPRHPLGRRARQVFGRDFGSRWARRSRFVKRGRPLLVTEVFLPELLALG